MKSSSRYSLYKMKEGKLTGEVLERSMLDGYCKAKYLIRPRQVTQEMQA